MRYTELTALIKTEAQTDESDFDKATEKIKKALFSLNKDQMLPLVKEIGAIPENISHDSTEEKLYAKTTDIILAKCFHELGLHAEVTKERTNCADIFVKSAVHGYTLVGDAKAFRLSRTAKNQKDFKVKSMVDWRARMIILFLSAPIISTQAVIVKFMDKPSTEMSVYWAGSILLTFWSMASRRQKSSIYLLFGTYQQSLANILLSAIKTRMIVSMCLAMKRFVST